MKDRGGLMDGRREEQKQPRAPLVYSIHHTFQLDNKRAGEQTDRKQKQLTPAACADAKVNVFCKWLSTGKRQYKQWMLLAALFQSFFCLFLCPPTCDEQPYVLKGHLKQSTPDTTEEPLTHPRLGPTHTALEDGSQPPRMREKCLFLSQL